MRVASIDQVRRSTVDILLPLTILQAEFHPIFGPVLMVTYACLSNTLLLTGLCQLFQP